MFDWLKKFMNWPEGGIKNISDLGGYVKKNWLELIIFVVVLIVAIWVIVKVLKMIISLIRGN
jgi:hypothetical protein